MSNFVDVDDESVLSSIFKECFPETWRNNPDFAQYLTDLSSYGVDKLYREPERLAEEKTQILEQTQDLAFHNYKTFIETAECSRDIFKDFQIIESHVEDMLEKLPKLTEACHTFTKQAQDINVSRRLNNVTLARNTQLLEILEMPQLMDTCVRNQYYEEALELASHVHRLEKKHAHIPIIAKIVADIKACSQLMLKQLIQQLRSNVQLPACLKVIGYLRRMDVFSEAELRIKFLQARDAWFQSILAGIPSDDPYYHVTKTIEASRVHLFDIITQYRAVFSDDDSLMTPSKHSSHNVAALFHGWLIQKISQFLAVLEKDLQGGIGARLDSLLGQCMYFGLSFSRVGADFRGLLVPIFQRAALSSVRHAVCEADDRFDEEMQSFTLLGTQHSLPSSAYSLASQVKCFETIKNVSAAMCLHRRNKQFVEFIQTPYPVTRLLSTIPTTKRASILDLAFTTCNIGTGSLQAPIGLLEVPPMANYCNALLSAFNDLRLCAPLSLACDVTALVEESLRKVAQVIIAYHRAEETTFNTDERARFSELCVLYAEQLVPHFNRCLQHLFPPALLAQTLGLTAQQLSDIGTIGCLDIEEIIEPLKFLLPEKPSPTAAPKIEEGEETSETSTNADETGSKEEDATDPSTIKENVEHNSENDENQEVGQVQTDTKDNATENIPLSNVISQEEKDLKENSEIASQDNPEIFVTDNSEIGEEDKVTLNVDDSVKKTDEMSDNKQENSDSVQEENVT